MRATRFQALVLLLAASTLAGCGKSNNLSSPLASSPGGAPGSDQALVMSTLAAVPQVVDDGLADASDQTTLGDQAGTAANHPLTYWRRITGRERTFEFAFSDTDETGQPTTAVVTIHKRLTGTFNILAGIPGTDGSPIDSVRDIIRKPLDDRWVRRVLLKRVRLSAEGGDPRWKVAAVSGVKVTSKDATTHIVSLRVQFADKDTTIYDPLAFRRMKKILCLPPENQITLTVTTERNDDVVVLQHFLHRFRFHNNGDNTYTGVWPTGVFMRGLRHFGINALSNGTLFDDQAPYDSQAWLFHYSLEPENVLADYLP